jgi:phosphoribosylanthranilate isomerase
MEYVKVCGLKNVEEAELCAKYGANAIGFIYQIPESIRNLEKKEIKEIITLSSGNILRVLVIRPQNLAKLEKIMMDIKVDLYQIHGHFRLEELKNIPQKLRLKIIIALKVNRENLKDIIKIINTYKREFFAYLIDNSEGKRKELNIEFIKEIFENINNSNIILAGGIDYENVEVILKDLKPFGIDVSSSLESNKGEKDPLKIKNFLERIKQIKANL